MSEIIIYVLFIIVALWNGYVIEWQQTKVLYERTKELPLKYKAKKYSNIWHTLGLLLRIGLWVVVILPYWGEWLEILYRTGIVFTLSNTFYDGIINMVMKNGFFYIDNKNFNALLIKIFTRKGLWILRGLIFIVSSYFTIFV